ncbi:L,D-transpeptidase [Aureimonas fodinaquatilis]|uniref:L,D-transpeptidase n=1 Tax=Aureimonas fodinaquatilis TaxID=2565783 RepID=A0A5B0E1M5_9HYPH|nr:L,D-transpeptidase [Aureimonas fodinaquatilis]KAA0971871.1 L,D-transpeptidase [Aureimonas fodinaquatilis]
MNRLYLTAVLFCGLAGIATALPAQAQATRHFNHADQRWESSDRTSRATRTMPKPDARFARTSVSLTTREKPGTIIIDTDRKFLYHVHGNNSATRYGVGVGKEGFSWGGAMQVGRKAEWPGWTPPARMRERERAKGRILPAYMKGGPDNPLGARALYLYRGGKDSLFRIHGTNQPWTIGQNMSSGCIRMLNEDVIHLYGSVTPGTKVVVIGPGGAGRDAVYTETGRSRTAGGLGQIFGG